MNSNASIDAALWAARVEAQQLLLVLTAPYCPKCEKLKIALNDKLLQKYCAEKNIRFQMLKLGTRRAEEEEAQTGSGPRVPPVRERLGIKTLPTLVLLDENSRVLCSTLYLLEGEKTGGLPYVDWLKEMSLV